MQAQRVISQHCLVGITHTLLTDALIIAGSVLASVVFLFLVTRSSEAHTRKEFNDFTGAVVAVIGTTYAVILAFMLSGVWNMYQAAEKNEEQEANALVNVWQISAKVPTAQAEQIRALCVRYAKLAVEKEWPAMAARAPITAESSGVVNQLWQVTGQSQADSSPDSIAVYQLVEEMRMLTEYRRIRIMGAREGLPAILWTVLIAGGIITVSASCFFGVPSFRFHILQVLLLSFLLSLALVAIADVDRPYQGTVAVRPEGFRFALQTFEHSTE